MSKRKDAKIALLHSRQQELKTLVQDGRMEEAMDSAQKWGLDVDAVLEAVGQEPGPVSSPHFHPPSEVFETPEPPKCAEPEPAKELWPLVADVSIASHPLNKRLYVVRLDDGRRANLWRMGATFPVGAGVRVKLVEMVGDQPYYELTTS
jgi:hypothetical protein